MTAIPTRLRRTLASATLTLLTVFGVLLGSGTAQAIDARAATDTYLFNTSLARFGQIRAQAPNSDQLDWSSDGCSMSPDKPVGFNLKPACDRHDFGYRNYKRQGRFDAANRLRIDNNFKSDMYGICGGNWACKRIADIYYAAVRQFGGPKVAAA